MATISPLFARQPIFDRDIKTVAYELLFRGGQGNQAEFIDGDHATSHVLFYAFGHNRIEEIIGNAPAYINFTPQLLVYPPPLPPEKLVIEVLETVKPDKWIFEGIKKLKKQGYQIALDDFFLNKDTKALLHYADIIKVDVMALSKSKLNSYAEFLRPLKLKLLAEKIETKDVFNHCKGLGFELFQGYFLAKPEVIEGRKISEGKQSILKLLSVLMSNTVEMQEVVDAISTDPRLSFRILKIVNSTTYHIPSTIQSLNQAVTMLGLNLIRNWAAFLLLTGDDQDKPKELSLMCMTRAKLCERLAVEAEGKQLAESCFTAGLLSTFDAFLDLPMVDILGQINLSTEMTDALLHYQGRIGSVLELCLALEKAQWQAISNHPIILNHRLSEETLNACYIEASKWALDALCQY